VDFVTSPGDINTPGVFYILITDVSPEVDNFFFFALMQYFENHQQLLTIPQSNERKLRDYCH